MTSVTWTSGSPVWVGWPAAEIVGATELPVNVDFEAVEDFSGRANGTIYDRAVATARIAAAADALHGGDAHVVLTARAENYLHGRRDLTDTIARLQAYQEAGADVLYAPGVTDPGELRSLVAAVDLPVNVLALPGAPSVAELGEIGVSRVSVGSGFSLVALGAVVEAARELLDDGTYGFWSVAAAGVGAVRAAFAPPGRRSP